MRFVELRPAPDRGSFPLHRRITWLRGLDPAARVSIVGLVHDVALGNEPDWDGVVEIDGEHHALRETVPTLGVTAENALIIDAASLPEATGGDSPSGRRGALDSAEQKLAELDARIDEIAEELAASDQVRSQMVAHLTSAKSRVDDEASLVLDRADGELVRAARLADRPDPWTGMDDVPGRIAELGETIAELDVALAALPSGDRAALAAAAATFRAAISAPTDGATAPNPEAAALAQAWISLHQRLRGLESRMEATGGGTEAAAERLDAARHALRVAEDAAVPRKITDEETALLEELHDRMIDAEHRAGRGVRRGASRAAFEDAERELRNALEPLGYPTWAAFRMGNGMAAVPPEAFVEYERAQQVLEVAEIEWAELMARLERDTELQDVMAAIDRAQEHAATLLGTDPPTGDGPDAVAKALQSLRVDAADVGVAKEAALRHLLNAMGQAGVIGHQELTSDEAVVALAESWLKVLVAADDLAVRILRDRERAEEELEALEALGDGSRVDRLHDERAAVREAESAVAETRAALDEILQSRLQLHVLAATELALAEEHDDRLVQRQSAQVLVDLAARRVEGRASTDTVAALAERVPRGDAGPIPVVVVMGNAPADHLDRLDVLPDDVQVLVIGDVEGADGWLERVGPDVALGVEAGSLV